MGKPRLKKHRRHKRHAPPGAAPGTLSIPANFTKPVLRLMSYDAQRFDEKPIEDPSELRAILADTSRVHWIDVRGLGDENVLRELAEIFDIHPLALEDIAHVPQRPKIESYDHHLFIIARTVVLKTSHDMESETIALFLGPNYVLTLHEAAPECFDPVIARLRKPGGRHRKSKADYLLYSLLDAIIDNFFPVLEVYGEYLEGLEEETVTHPHAGTLTAIHCAKRELIELRRVLWPQRDMIGNLIREDTDLIAQDVRIYLRDCLDHSIHVMDMVESYREITSGLHDVYLSAVGQRTNEIMRVLTIISTIFIPLTFIVGVYGMNFNTETSAWNMPELNWKYGYPATIAVMVLISAVQLFFFWKKGWIFRVKKEDSNAPAAPQVPVPGTALIPPPPPSQNAPK
jgi:magnesium transporter